MKKCLHNLEKTTTSTSLSTQSVQTPLRWASETPLPLEHTATSALFNPSTLMTSTVVGTPNYDASSVAQRVVRAQSFDVGVTPPVQRTRTSSAQEGRNF
eukprot:TRINITY_DN8266_c0_g1_i1.p1 TRINITY_DN8266_c0_g1~~TRINITY_DN8266_c0_g1_i1.p1  ORF type:complete len:106 (+),score=14.96 TRINITY_DN8266_c0_g1_i1:23-319(+)